MEKQFVFTPNTNKEYKNIFLIFFLFFLIIVAFLVGAVCGANLYHAASNNELKYLVKKTATSLGANSKPSDYEEFLHWWWQFINEFNN